MAKKDEEQRIAVRLQEVETKEGELIEEHDRIEKELTEVRRRKAQLQDELRALDD